MVFEVIDQVIAVKMKIMKIRQRHEAKRHKKELLRYNHSR
jgi:hypothetical protein